MLFALVCAWLLIGIVCSFVMARRGHDPWSWGVLGALFGPLIVPLALAAARRDRGTDRIVHVWHTGERGAGPISVLVGVDGSLDSEAAACTVVELFGPRLGRLTLAAVVDFEAAESARAGDGVFSAEAREVLEDPAGYVADFDPDTVVLTGEPAHALLEYARDNDIDLLAVGTHGRGLSKAVLGSVAARLVRQRDIPVLVVGVETQPASEVRGGERRALKGLT